MTAALQFGEDYSDAQADYWHETEVVCSRPALTSAGSSASLLDYAASVTETDQTDGERYH